MMARMTERRGTARVKFLLAWTWHPRPLNTAVANSALLIATRFGMDVTLLCPEEAYRLDGQFETAARANTEASGGSFRISHDIDSAYRGADVVYAKSWGALDYYGRWDAEKAVREASRSFTVDEEKMSRTDGARFMHCLPVRRNVVVTDEVIDSESSAVLDQAENRLWAQMSLLSAILGEE